MEASPHLPLPAWTDDAPSCTLPTAERPLRQAEFDALFVDTLVDARRPAPDHVTMTLAGPAGTEERVRDLAARESSCCSFFDFTVTPEPSAERPEALTLEAVTLEVRVPPAHTAVLGALLARARSAAGQGAA